MMITLGPIRVAGFAILAVVLPATWPLRGADAERHRGLQSAGSAKRRGASALPAPPGAPGRDLAQARADGSGEPRELPAHGGIPVAGARARARHRRRASRGGSGEKTDPNGSVVTESPDPLLKGMDAERRRSGIRAAIATACEPRPRLIDPEHVGSQSPMSSWPMSGCRAGMFAPVSSGVTTAA